MQNEETTDAAAEAFIPQRPLPPMPEADPHEHALPPVTRAAINADLATDRQIGEAPLDAITHDDAIPLVDNVGEPDPYAQIEGPRPWFVRQPFGEPRLKLQAPARPGFRRYWFNDEPGRIQRALAAGYMFVKANGRNTRNVVGRNKTGAAQIAYLMEIPMDLFMQDVAAQQRRVDEVDNAIRGGELGAKPGERASEGDNRYIPKEGIRYNPRGA